MTSPTTLPCGCAGLVDRRSLLAAALFVPAAVISCRRQVTRPRPLLTGLLQLATEQGETRAAVAAAGREIDRIAIKVAAAHQGGRDVVAALGQVVFADLGFSREVDRTDLQFVLLPPVTAARKGSCVGLGTLYLVLAEQLGLPLEGVLVPGHFFVRARSADSVRNVELLRQGEVTTDDFYHQRYPTTSPPAAAYWRALSVPEVLAVVLYNVGNERRRQGRLDEAEASYRRATEAFPGFAEAQASWGLALHLQGRLQQARRAYAAAQSAQPDLPGLATNLAALETEIASAAAPGTADSAAKANKPLAGPSVLGQPQ